MSWFLIVVLFYEVKNNDFINQVSANKKTLLGTSLDPIFDNAMTLFCYYYFFGGGIEWAIMHLMTTAARDQQLVRSTRVVTKINGHRDKRSSDLSNLNSVKNKIAQTK